MKTKKCAICKETKSIDDFNKSSRSKDGLQYRCKECTKSSSKKKPSSKKVEVPESPKVEVKEVKEQLATPHIIKEPSSPPYIIEEMIKLRKVHNRVLKKYFNHK